MSESDVRAYAAERHFSAPTLARWLAESAPDRDALLAVAVRLRMGENQFRDLYAAAADLAVRDGTSIAVILHGAAVRDALTRPLGRNEAIKALKLVLRRLRYPQLSAVEQRLDALVKELRLPSGVRVEFPANLEGDQVTVVLRAGSAAELRAQSDALAFASRGAAVDQLFALLEGKW